MDDEKKTIYSKSLNIIIKEFSEKDILTCAINESFWQ